MIRIAAVGDIHLGAQPAGTYRPLLKQLPDQADVLLLAGDLTRLGTLEETAVVAGEISDVGVPVVAVLGNHDHHDNQPEQVASCLRSGGITVLEGSSTVVPTAGGLLGIAGTKGFGGGFPGSSASEFGEHEMKEFVGHSRRLAEQLQAALLELDRAEPSLAAKVALTHYSPIPETLEGEPVGIYAFLGTYLLAEAIDTGGAQLALHGHAHAGSEKGATAGGVPVRNVAAPVIRTAYYLYQLG